MYCKDCKWLLSDWVTRQQVGSELIREMFETNCMYDGMLYNESVEDDFGCIHFEAKEGE